MPDSFKAQLIILKRPMQLDICLSGGGEPYCVGSVERSECENGCVGSTGRTGVGRVSSYSDIILVGVQEALDDTGGWLGCCSNKKRKTLARRMFRSRWKTLAHRMCRSRWKTLAHHMCWTRWKALAHLSRACNNDCRAIGYRSIIS